MKYIILWVAFLGALLIAFPLSVNLLFFEKSGSNENDENFKKITVYFADEDTVKTMDLNEYILGVVSAEMPASFEYEALKAQAVAARTYTINKIENNTVSKEHKGADICTDFYHCQAYTTSEDACKKWSENARNYLKKCKNAVKETGDTIMVYDGEVVKAVFHSSSSGKTENAENVWGGSVPYLVSVDSPGEELCPSHKSMVSVSVKDFKKTVSEKYNVDFEKNIIGKIKKTSSGSVEYIEIGNLKIKGTDIRTMFGLRSACFDVKINDGNVTFDVTGNGHGVGMSQYGANYLASLGYDYEQILKKYYTGVKFCTVSDIEKSN